MARLFVVLTLLEVVYAPISDLRLLSSQMNHTLSDQECQSLGYDGLAVLGSPESFNYALRVTEGIRAQGSKVSIGISLQPGTTTLRWYDGIVAASDTPWLYPPPDVSGNRPYGAMTSNGKVLMTDGSAADIPLCGKYDRMEIFGTKVIGQQLSNLNSVLNTLTLTSFIQCVFECGRDHRCRVAEFRLDQMECTILAPGSSYGYVSNTFSTLFIRADYDV